MNKLAFTALTVLTFSFNTIADELEVGSKYRTSVNIKVSDKHCLKSGEKKPCDDRPTLDVGAQSKFKVLSNSDKETYAIRFIEIYKVRFPKKKQNSDSKSNFDLKNSDVFKGKEYFLKRKTENGSSVENIVTSSLGGIASGPLIVPFKYRLDDKSLSGNATIGYYAGLGWDSKLCTLIDEPITITPFISMGVTQVTITKQNVDSKKTDDETKTGFTLAIGLFIRNWDAVNIGLVYGQDRIGEKTWAHEGEPWLSLSVGWDL